MPLLSQTNPIVRKELPDPTGLRQQTSQRQSARASLLSSCPRSVVGADRPQPKSTAAPARGVDDINEDVGVQQVAKQQPDLEPRRNALSVVCVGVIIHTVYVPDDRNGKLGTANDRYGATVPNVRTWSARARQFFDRFARNLTLNSSLNWATPLLPVTSANLVPVAAIEDENLRACTGPTAALQIGVKARTSTLCLSHGL